MTKSKIILEKFIDNIPKKNISIDNNLIAKLSLIAKYYKEDLEIYNQIINTLEILINLQKGEK